MISLNLKGNWNNNSVLCIEFTREPKICKWVHGIW